MLWCISCCATLTSPSLAVRMASPLMSLPPVMPHVPLLQILRDTDVDGNGVIDYEVGGWLAVGGRNGCRRVGGCAPPAPSYPGGSFGCAHS
jgi:hypothetical protein